jgi:hypothetical protein
MGIAMVAACTIVAANADNHRRPTKSAAAAWAAPSVHSERWMQYPRRRPIASSIMGFEDEVE